MSILRRIFPLLLTAALLCACVQMPNAPQDVLPAPTPQPTAAPAATPETSPTPTPEPTVAPAMATATSNATKDAPQIKDPTTWDDNAAKTLAGLETQFAAYGLTLDAKEGCPYLLAVNNAVGGVFMIRGQLTMGDYVAFSGLIWAIANPMRQMGNIMNEFQRFSAASKKVMELYYSEPKIRDEENAVSHPERFEGKIEFDNVSFQYEDGDLPVLHNISFTAHPNETVAIMGETGCGKTSLINLIPRFYEPTEGQIRIDGLPVEQLKLYDLRKQIGLATQDVLLYSDTIEGNIAYGDDSIKMNEVVKFARYSAAADFISKMPEGYDTLVGERGVGLSGGQKQRISLARALAIRPSVLILDDTTSAVDMETEKQIQQSLRELDFPCTKIVIAQRISTTKTADKIIVLQNGYIEEMGTHEELMEKKGYYYELVKLQTGVDEL